MTVIASYPLCNTTSINIYDVDHLEDKVLAGINDHEPEWCPIDYCEGTFQFADLNIPFAECMRTEV